MAGSFPVNVTDKATAVLKNYAQLAVRINPRVGQAVKILVANHLFAKGPNKMGFPSTHFYAGAGKATAWYLNGTGVTVTIAQQGIGQRYRGGPINPTDGKKYLTIPARSEAYGKRAGEFGNLKILFGRQRDGTIGPVALIADKGGATRKVFGGREGATPERKIHGAEEGIVLFWLVKSVNQQADVTVLPSDEAIAETALTAIEKAVKQLGGGQWN
jgi:hypothetical protein